MGVSFFFSQVDVKKSSMSYNMSDNKKEVFYKSEIYAHAIFAYAYSFLIIWEIIDSHRGFIFSYVIIESLIHFF